MYQDRMYQDLSGRTRSVLTTLTHKFAKYVVEHMILFGGLSGML